MNPKISVVTVCFNAADCIEKTILSVINQTYKNIEYIIIDGGSTDGTVDIIKKYADCIDYWVSEPDKGIYDAMNKGIKVATGEWINFMNAGDCFGNMNILQQMEKEITSDIRILRGNIIRIYPKYKIKSVGVIKQDPKLIDMFDNTFHHQACLIQTSLFEEYGIYSTDYKLCSDWKFFFDCVVLYKVKSKYINIDVANFQMGGASSENSILYQKEREKYLTKVYGEELFGLLSELSYYRKSKLIRSYHKVYNYMLEHLSQKNFNRILQMKRLVRSILRLHVN